MIVHRVSALVVSSLLLCLFLSGRLVAVDAPLLVDLQPDGTPIAWRASGFLHSLSPALPIDERIIPLRPQRWRLSPDLALKAGARAARLAQAIEVVVSDRHGYREAGAWPGDNGDWSAWETLVAEVTTTTGAVAPQRRLDIWNEADAKTFWQRDRGRFLEAWSRGWRAARKADPSVQLIGPSYSFFDLADLTAFLDHCQTAGTMPDILSWHELRDRDVERIGEHVASARALLAARGLAAMPIEINEYLPRRFHMVPGATVVAIAQIERSGISGACRSCWREPDGRSNGAQPTLDGLLDFDQQPRAVWWVMQRYGSMSGRLCRASDPLVLASADGGQVQVLVPGRFGGRMLTVNGLSVPLAGWKGDIELVPDLQYAPLKQPVRCPVVQEVVGDGLCVRLPPMQAGDACFVTLRRH